MKHVTYADKSMLIGTEAADLLMEYAAALISAHAGDTVELKAVGSDGNSVEAIFLLGEGAPLMAESASADLPEPDNSVAMEYMRERLQLLTSPPSVTPVEPTDLNANDFGAFDEGSTGND